MRISREKTIKRVETALTEQRPEFQSAAWDAAWTAIRKLKARGIGNDSQIAEELMERMRTAVKRPHPTP